MQIATDLGPDGIVRVTVRGSLDTSCAEAFYSEVASAIQEGQRRVLVDCSSLEYVSSLGIAMLIRLHSRMKAQGGDVKLVGLPSMLRDVLVTTRLNRLFGMYPDESSAVQAFIDEEDRANVRRHRQAMR